MASIKQMETKDGKRFFQICVSRGYGKAPYKTRWYWPDGWSRRTAEREAAKQAAEFERACAAGEIMNRAQEKEKAAQEAAEEAKIRTFKQYGEQVFMPTKRINCAEKTRAYYQGALDNHLYPAFGSCRLPEITSAQISAFFLKLKESGLAHSTIIGIYVTCNQLFKQAYMDETISKNPMDRVQRPRQRKEEQKKGVEAFTADELKSILSLLDNEPLKWRCFVRLLIDTGIRRGEACALKWESIDLKDNSALIKENLCYTPDKGVYIDVTKTGRERVVYFSQEVAALLKQYRSEQVAATARRKARLIKDKQPLQFEKIVIPDYVFTERGNSEPMHPDAVNRFFQKFGKKHGIEIHAHKLRHSFASLAIVNGSDIASVSEVLGHADKATTLRVYSHADEESKRRAAGIVAAAIKQA
jgi:integrase